MDKKYKRKKCFNKTLKKISQIKSSIPKIVFKANNIIVTLKSKSQLDKWMDIYPHGKYQINY